MVERILQIIYRADTGTYFWLKENNIFPYEKEYEFTAINFGTTCRRLCVLVGGGARGTISQQLHTRNVTALCLT